MEFTAQVISEYLKGEIIGNPDEEVTTISRIEEGEKGALAFLANPKYNKYIYDTKASIVLVNRDFVPEQPIRCTLIKVDDAYQAFAALLNLYSSSLPQKKGIEPNSFISSSAKLGNDCYVGGFAYIGERVAIGNNVKIYPQVYLGDDVTVGDNTILYPGVKIYKECKVGSNCIIHGSTVIGSDGFGFAPAEGAYLKVPQIGNVVIGDEVEIGSNVSVDRATIGSTIIHKGVKLDNLIQVAHNVEIGENTGIAAQTGISGSTKIGKNCIIAGQVGIVGHITIADRTTLAAQSGVPNSVREEGEILLGSPAVSIRDARKSITIYRKLPELYARLNAMEKELEELKSRKV